MRKLTHGSLFSGIGGFDLAAEWMGWDNKFHCEWNEFGQKVLNHYWPNAESFTDITKTDFTKYANKIDILTGGFPCQPYSSAGKRKGKEDERHLWPEMLRAIREVSPRFVVGENVRGLTNWNGGMVFEEVCAELESYGYQVAPVIIPACAVNAPHKRERIWFVAYNDSKRQPGHEQQTRNRINSENPKQRFCVCKEKGWDEIRCINEGNCKDRFTTNAESSGISEQQRSYRERQNRQLNNNGESENVTDADGRGTQSQQNIRQTLSGKKRTNSDGSEWDVTNSSDKGLQRSELVRTPERGKWKQNDSRESATKLHKIENWQQFPTQPPVCSGDDGISSELDGITFPKWRAESIKAYGNAIVPQVAYQIFKAIEKTLYL
jgi:DNA (cytosine-5)-methyltransferase 1